MPWANPRPCPVPGCGALARGGGRCKAHRLAADRERGSPDQRGYDDQHRDWRLLILARDAECQGWPPGRHRPPALVGAVVADHIIPRRLWAQDREEAARRLGAFLAAHHPREGRGAALAEWSLDNGQGLCISCHNRKSRREKNSLELPRRSR